MPIMLAGIYIMFQMYICSYETYLQGAVCVVESHVHEEGCRAISSIKVSQDTALDQVLEEHRGTGSRACARRAHTGYSTMCYIKTHSFYEYRIRT